MNSIRNVAAAARHAHKEEKLRERLQTFCCCGQGGSTCFSVLQVGWVKDSIVATMVLAVYLGSGIAFYCAVEEKPCEDAAADDDCVEPWTAIDAAYFTMVTMSTVGYGDL